ncbi:MAG: cytochrome B [Rhodospirillaceae bacterium]|nr:cytochrome B [Rhodospirillaceae bacterium]|tara:strand:+ start:1737 stop:2405 length:669 start_codon:yes stop_codon:yes gene_type:complete
MIQRLYDRTIQLAAHPYAVWWLLGVAVIESSFFPIPVEAMLLPMMFAAPRRAWLFAGIATVGSVVGGIGGYAIGYLLFDTIGQPILSMFAHMDAATQASMTDQEIFFTSVVAPISGFFGQAVTFEEYLDNAGMIGAWVVFAGGFTPIPYKVVTVAGGFAQLDLGIFILASIGSRGLRFAIEAALLTYFGPPIRSFIEKRLALAATVSLVVVIAGVVALKWLL